MSIKEFTKSGTFVLVVLALVLLLLPFGLEQIGETTSLFKFPASKWVKEKFLPQLEEKRQLISGKVDLEKLAKEIESFSEWAHNLRRIQVTVDHPEVFRIVCVDANPVVAGRVSWKLQLLSDDLKTAAAQVRNKLTLFFDPEDKVSGRIESVKPLSGDERGYLVTMEGVRGEGMIGLSYDRLPPVYYDVRLRRIWPVSIVSCRSAMKGHYDAAAFFAGIEKEFTVGAVIAPENDKCGYRILSISDQCVWLEVLYGNDPLEDTLLNEIWPDFLRIDVKSSKSAEDRLVYKENIYFNIGDVIKHPNSELYLTVDEVIAGNEVAFRLQDSSMRPIRDLLCVIVGERE